MECKVCQYCNKDESILLLVEDEEGKRVCICMDCLDKEFPGDKG